MESIHANATARLRVRQWLEALATDGMDTAEATVLTYVLDAWFVDLTHRLEAPSPYRNTLHRYTELKQTITYINWMMDRLTASIPEGQNMVSAEDRPLFELIRDAGLDLSFRVMGIERANSGEDNDIPTQ